MLRIVTANTNKNAQYLGGVQHQNQIQNIIAWQAVKSGVE